jgi:ABC-type glycerol-3-phosphate transport system permease component
MSVTEPAKLRSLRRKRKVATVWQLAFTLLAVVFTLVPILWALITSFKTTTEISQYPPTLYPHSPTLEHYIYGVFVNPEFLHYLFNTALVVLASIVICLTCSALAAHAVARYRFRGRELLMFMMFSTVMIPGVAVVIPLYLMAVYSNLYDTIWCLVLVYSAWLTPTLIWLLRGFVIGIPLELEEAARIDGCSRIGAFFRIVLPLLKPGLLAGTVLIFTNIWNEFLIGYSLVQSNSARIVQVGIYSNLTEVGLQWGRLTADAMIALLPVLIMYGFMQKSFVQGLSAGAVKG